MALRALGAASLGIFIGGTYAWRAWRDVPRREVPPGVGSQETAETTEEEEVCLAWFHHLRA